MYIIKHPSNLQRLLVQLTAGKKSLGFVPTMGALHEGHLSLVKESQKQCDCTIVSIFVNPLQFNDPSDFSKYPVTTEDDLELLLEQKVDYLFLPSREDIYPDGQPVAEKFHLGDLDHIFEGKFRPGHFQGVCAVVNRLLEIVKPNLLFLGQKDYQQIAVIRRMIELKKHKVEIITCPIKREPNGLAMSSRNERLAPKEREAAGAIFSQLQMIKANIRQTPFALLKQRAAEHFQMLGFRPEYLALAKADSLDELSEFQESVKTILLCAVFIGDVRLIDNLLI